MNGDQDTTAEVIIALDRPSVADALELVDLLGDEASFYKVGLELFCREGPGILPALRRRSKRVFLDLKLHDIPNTVAGAVRAAADHEVELLTVHTTGGASMLSAAVEAADGRVRLLGVTLLTSFPASEVEATWGRPLLSIRDEVVRLADTARAAGLAGVVASPLEVEAIRRKHGDALLVVTPGIRLPGGDAHDQSRVSTPAAAVAAGSDYLVVGRAVTAAPDPVGALAAVRSEMDSAGAARRA